MADYIRPTPRNPLLGLLADAMLGGVDWMQDPRRTQQMQLLGGLISDTGIPQTVDRIASGEPLTKGAGFATRMKPETAAAAMTLGPEVVPIGRAAMGAARAAERGAMAVGRAGERYAERVVPQIMERGGLPAEMVAAMGQGTQSPLTVYHGSPHRFTKFDASKIGTGEGAQAYGHGLYVAESPEVAKGYQTATSKDRFLTKDGFFDPSTLEHLNVKAVVRRGDLDQAISEAQKYAKADPDYPEAAAKAARDLAKLQALKASGGMKPNEGALYKIDLPDEHVARMLDWDKPLSQQAPGVTDALFNAYPNPALERMRAERWKRPSWADGDPNAKYMDAISAGTKYNALASELQSYAKASQALREAGIPGIRYLDQGSRGAGQGTSNFVIFPGEEDLLRILSVNGGLLTP